MNPLDSRRTVADSRLVAVDSSQLMALDQLRVSGIEVWGYHGVFDFERRDGQPFLIDVTWWQDLSAAGRADDLALTTDYGQVAAWVAEATAGEPVDLIETLAARLQQGLLDQFAMEAVQVRVHKPQAPLSVRFDDVILTTAVRGRSETWRPVVFALGSNIEPRWSYLQYAVAALASTPGIERAQVSPVYETAPVGVEGHGDYLNAVVVAWSTLPSRALLERGLAIESSAHRIRLIEHGPRTLDIDLIMVGDETLNEPGLVLPHPRAHQRAFVLRPWLDLVPTATLSGQPLADHLARIADQPIIRQETGLFLP